MNPANTEAIERLLRRAGSAHGVYEESVLHGVYDENWPIWYAQWILDHGFNTLVARPVDAGHLSRLLADLHKQHTQTDKAQPWPVFYAARLVEHLD